MKIVGGKGFPSRRIFSLGTMGMVAWSDSRAVRTSSSASESNRKTGKAASHPRKARGGLAGATDLIRGKASKKRYGQKRWVGAEVASK